MTLAPAVAVGLVEGRRLVRNPILWVATAPAFGWAVGVNDPVVEHFLLTGYGLVVMWFAAMAATAFAARRSDDDLVRGALDPLPASADARTLGIGIGSLGAAAVALAVTAAVWAIRTPGAVLGTTTDTVPVGIAIPRPNLAQLLQGPLVVLVFAALGLLVGRWVAGWLMVAVLFVPVLAQLLYFGVWNAAGSAWYAWLLPMTTGWVTGEWLGSCSSGASQCDLQVSGFDTITPWWHAAYLVALACFLVSIAVALEGRRSARWWSVATGAAVVALAVVQVVTFERWAA